MPTRPAKPCSIPRCPNLTSGGKCDEHRAVDDRRRGTATERGYDERWARRRIEFLSENPICVDCGKDAEVPDHDPIPRRELVAMGVDDPDADEHLVPRCIPCHNSKTRRTGR